MEFTHNNCYEQQWLPFIEVFFETVSCNQVHYNVVVASSLHYLMKANYISVRNISQRTHIADESSAHILSLQYSFLWQHFHC